MAYNFRVRPISSCEGHSLIEWGEGHNLRSIQVETEIAILWAAAEKLRDALVSLHGTYCTLTYNHPDDEIANAVKAQTVEALAAAG